MTDRTNIADRSRAALMGHETRRKRQAVEDAIIEDLAVRHKGAAKIKVWWKTFVLLNPEAAKPWKGAMPMGHDGGPPTPIVRGAKAANDLPVPADYLTVETHISRTSLDSWQGRKSLSVYGRRVSQTIDGEIHKQIIEVQRFLGSI